MTKPAKQNKPEETANQEKCDRGQKSTLGQLAEPRDKKATDSGKNVTSRTLTHTSTVHSTFAESCLAPPCYFRARQTAASKQANKLPIQPNVPQVMNHRNAAITKKARAAQGLPWVNWPSPGIKKLQTAARTLPAEP